MRRYIQHEPFNIHCFEAATWQHPVHNHTYYEIIFIQKGKGKHSINGNKFDYRKGDIFLLGPEDYHAFEIATPTRYCYIRFIESIIKDSTSDKNKSWQQTIKLLLHSRFQSLGSIVQQDKEKKKLAALLTVLQTEYDNRNDPGFEVIRDSLMKAMMTILARNLSKQMLPKTKTKSTLSDIEDIVLYIRQHIYDPACLRIEPLSKKFNYAPGYLSIYFKKNTGEPLKQFILKYKLKLVETRLLYSNASLTEIADELGFTDESHLCKQFKKYSGFPPGDFRNKRSLKR